MKSLALLTIVLALGYAGYRNFFTETPKPATVAEEAAPAGSSAEAPSAVEPPKNTYQCSYTPSVQANAATKDLYGVNVPTQADPSLETDLSGIAKVALNLSAVNYLVAQISTSTTGDFQPSKLLAEGQFSMKDALDLAAIKDGVKVGTLTCGMVSETAAVPTGTN